MSEPARSTSTAAQVAVVVTTVALALNALFYVLSDRYVAGLGARATAGELGALRGAFAVFSSAVAAAAIAAGFAPRALGHGLAGALGAVVLASGVAALRHGLPSALWAALLVLGGLMPLLAWRSWQGRRAAWAFLVVICGTLGVCLFFGAPKVRGLLHIGLWHALVLPGLLFTATAALASQHRAYRG